MAVLQTLYPYLLAVANVAVGWLFVEVLDTTLGVLLVTLGLLIFLAAFHERFRPPTATIPAVSPQE